MKEKKFHVKKSPLQRANSHRCITQKWITNCMNAVTQLADSLYIG